MKLRILNENDEISINQQLNDNNTSYSDEIKDKKMFNTFKTTVLDYLSRILFNGMPININLCELNNKISSDITNLFTNTKIDVYVYDSKIPNAFTIPGANIEADTMRVPALWQYFTIFIPILGPFILLIWLAVVNCKRIMTSFSSGYKDNLLSYDDLSNKFTIPIQGISIFISSAIIEGMNDDEIKAILLHEIGHNTQVSINIINQIFSMSFAGATVGSIIYIGNNNEKNLYMPFIIIFMVGFFIIKYLSRKQEVYSDEFAIKTGYGEALNSALTKLKSYTYGFGNPMIKLNVFDKVLYYIIKVGSTLITNVINFLHLGTYPSWGQRLKMIDRKTEKFNNEPNKDLSKHIEPYYI